MLLLLLALPACHEAPFHAPPQPDLYKVPYDFGPAPDGDLVAADLSMPKEIHHDLSVPHEDLDTEHD